MSLERLWAGWRTAYVEGAAGPSEGGCVFCAILDSGEPDEATFIVWRGRKCFAVLNAYPYTSGHLMVMPYRHAAELEDLTTDEATEMWAGVIDAVRALKSAYSPEGLNVGLNLGRPAGAGIPGHVHVHALPRWNGDTNFVTTVANTRVMPEALSASWERVTKAWPAHD